MPRRKKRRPGRPARQLQSKVIWEYTPDAEAQERWRKIFKLLLGEDEHPPEKPRRRQPTLWDYRPSDRKPHETTGWETTAWSCSYALLV